MSTQSPANDKPTGPNLVISLPSPEIREITTPCEVDNANTAPGERVTSSNSVTLDTQGISSIDFATEQPSLGVKAQPTTEEGQRQPSGSAPQVDPQADGTTSDVKTQELAALHAAWVSTRRPGWYRHLLTGATFHHPAGKAPRSSGPTAQDIPEGWKARLLEPTEEKWGYEHRATRITHDKPASLPKQTLENFAVAAKHGNLPAYCSALLLEDGQIAYVPVRYTSSVVSTPDWYTLEHPKLLQSTIRAYLDSYGTSSGPAEAVLFTGSQSRSVRAEDVDLPGPFDTLLVKDMDNKWINRFAEYGGAEILFFLIFHILGYKSNESAAEADVLQKAESLERLSQAHVRADCRHYCAVHDGPSHVLQFWESSPARGVLTNNQAVRISFYGSFPLVLTSAIHDTRIAEPTDITYKDATCWAAAPLQHRGQPSFDFHHTMFRLLGAWVKCQKLGLDADRIGVYSDDGFPWLLAHLAWKDSVRHLSVELDDLMTKAATGPSTEDFVWLNTCRRALQKFSDDLKDYVEGSNRRIPQRYLLSDYQLKAVNFLVAELEALQKQLPDMKQEFVETFQLLLGSSAVRDAEIQKALARESKIQAKRATALTALAAIYLPLSLATGVFGMNISEINGGIPRYWAVLALGLGLMLVSMPFLLWVFLDKDDNDKKPSAGQLSFGHNNNDGNHVSEAGSEKSVLSEDGTRHLMATIPAFLRRRTPGILRKGKPVSNGSQADPLRGTAQPGQMV